jgi:hypothetical protein
MIIKLLQRKLRKTSVKVGANVVQTVGKFDQNHIRKKKDR